jgi:hypothetical protein
MTAGLKLACSKGLGKAADDDGFETLEGRRGVEGLEVRVVGAVGGPKVGDPPIPDPSLLLVGREHGSREAGRGFTVPYGFTKISDSSITQHHYKQLHGPSQNIRLDPALRRAPRKSHE